MFKPISLLLLGLLLLSCSGAKDEASSTSPNILLFFVDDMGWQDTSVPFWKEETAFNRLYKTPNMERLARQGMKFTQAYATPVCSPTRVSLMTGMNAARHRVTNWTLHKDRLQPMETGHKNLQFPHWNVNGLSPDSTIQHAAYAKPYPMILQEAGYHTIHVGKAHFGNTTAFQNSPWPVPDLDKYHGDSIYLTEALKNEAIEALRTPVSNGQPFFLYMALYAVHTPIMADPRFVEPYLEMGLDTIEAWYASMVASMDKCLGDLMDFLQEKAIVDNTIILFMSDNGGLSALARGGEPHTHNKPLSSGKGSIHEGGIREPMLVKWPGVTKPESENDNYLIIEDFYPTILEMAGISDYETPQKIDGKSFVDLIKHPASQDQNRPLYWHYPNEWGPTGPGIGAFSAVRKGDWKLIYYHEEEDFELFNIKEDLGETQNLAATETSKLEELARELSNYLKEVDAQMPAHRESKEQVAWPIDRISPAIN